MLSESKIMALLSADGAPADASVDTLAQPVSADKLLARARYHGLVPLLHQALTDAKPPETPADEGYSWTEREARAAAATARGGQSWIAAAVREESMANVMWELAHRAELKRVLTGFTMMGVAPLLLKGAPLSFTHYSHPALRPRGDTDLLVASAERQRAEAALDRLGYRRGTGVTGKFVSYQADWSRRDSHRIEHHLDLHWRISNSQMLARRLTYEEMVATAEEIPALGPHARAPGAVHALLFACMHRAGHANVPYYSDGVPRQGGDRLIWLYDIHLLLTAMTDEQRDAFAEMASAKGLKAVCRQGIEATQRAFGTAVPLTLAKALEHSGPPEPTEQLLRGGRLQQMWGDVRALDSWSDRLGLLREHALPGRSYMAQKYPNARLRWLPILYARRAWGGLRRLKTPRG
jgi:hypothetical protein